MVLSVSRAGWGWFRLAHPLPNETVAPEWKAKTKKSFRVPISRHSSAVKGKGWVESVVDCVGKKGFVGALSCGVGEWLSSRFWVLDQDQNNRSKQRGGGGWRGLVEDEKTDGRMDGKGTRIVGPRAPRHRHRHRSARAKTERAPKLGQGFAGIRLSRVSA